MDIPNSKERRAGNLESCPFCHWWNLANFQPRYLAGCFVSLVRFFIGSPLRPRALRLFSPETSAPVPLAFLYPRELELAGTKPNRQGIAKTETD